MGKRLGVYIGEDRNDGPNVYLRKGDFCYYINNTTNLAYVPTVTVMPLDRPYFKVECLCKTHGDFREWVVPIESIQEYHCDIHHEDRYREDVDIYNIKYIIWDSTSIDQVPVEIMMKSPMCSRTLKLTHKDYILNWLSRSSVPQLKYGRGSDLFKKPATSIRDFWPTDILTEEGKKKFYDYSPDSSVVPDAINKEIKKAFEKEELKKSLEKSIINSYYGVGGFTTNTEPFKVVKMAEKETKTMEKKTMTETDTFLKHINGITITSTYSKLDYGMGKPYYIYYPEMEITEDMADTLLTVLLMAKREYIHKVVFNPEKGTTTVNSNYSGPVTVKCIDGEFDYILGYNMARNKMYLGSDDYNWFNKIKNHRKTHIEYTEKPTEPKAKRTSKKGGKK